MGSTPACIISAIDMSCASLKIPQLASVITYISNSSFKADKAANVTPISKRTMLFLLAFLTASTLLLSSQEFIVVLSIHLEL